MYQNLSSIEKYVSKKKHFLPSSWKKNRCPPLLHSALLQMYPTTPVNWSETLLSSMCIPNMMANKVIFALLGSEKIILSISVHHVIILYLALSRKFQNIYHISTLLYLVIIRKYQYISFSTFLYLPLNYKISTYFILTILHYLSSN